jgi:hypothetical protein
MLAPPLCARQLWPLAGHAISSAVKNAEFSNFSMRRQHIPALDFAGIGALRAHFLANSDRGIPSNRNL